MYLDYFGLKEEPFSLTPDPEFIFMSSQHEAALEVLLYGIRQRKGFLLLAGEIGTGKTTLCREIINRLENDTIISVVLNPFLSTKALLKAIHKDFGVKKELGEIDDYLNDLNEFLIERSQDGKNALIIIDEAQNLSIESLEMIRLLSNFETDKKKLLQILLIGQPEVEEKLNNYSLRQINQRISVRQSLDKLGFKDVCDYINHRLFVAGSRGNIVFKASALKAIFKCSQGYPRLLNKLCDRLMLAAFAQQSRTIDRHMVEASFADLNGKVYKKSWWRL